MLSKKQIESKISRLEESKSIAEGQMLLVIQGKIEVLYEVLRGS